MCGIAGIFSPGISHSDRLALIDAVKRMTNAQAHRGPDGEGVMNIACNTGVCVLGHRRLSIIDLSDAGNEPMTNAAGTIWLTYNGEIYNFRELRQELSARGYPFRSQTDAEVLLYGYEEWGIEGLLDRLRGMFAFALLDNSTEETRLFLAKDRFGIKPLYYYHDGKNLLFASEVRALMRSGCIANDENREAIIRFLQLGSVPVPLTTVKNVYALPAAYYLEVSKQGAAIHQYWRASDYLNAANPDKISAEEAIIQTRALLEETARLHLISDVPLGVFLSGGIDSSALVALTASLQEQPLTTLSVVFDEAEYNEAEYARLMATRYHTDHREVHLRSDDFYDALPQIFHAMDQPTIDGVNMWFISIAAKSAGLTVVLSGAGGDELFLGYSHHQRARRLEGWLRRFGKLPAAMRGGAIQAATKTGSLTGKRGLEKLTYLQNPSAENFYLTVRGLFTLPQIQELLGVSAKELAPFEVPPQPLNGTNLTSLTDAVMLLDFQAYLQNQLLKDTDVMSMAHSIEARVPFLDHKLAEYVLGLPQEWKFAAQMNKPLLVKALGESLPEAIWNRPKMGFTFPFGLWLKTHVKELREQSNTAGIFDNRVSEGIWAAFEAGKVHWSRVWALLVLSKQQKVEFQEASN
jgi:asparagine synthase (glutamine-hydrolysing)